MAELSQLTRTQMKLRVHLHRMHGLTRPKYVASLSCTGMHALPKARPTGLGLTRGKWWTTVDLSEGDHVRREDCEWTDGIVCEAHQPNCTIWYSLVKDIAPGLGALSPISESERRQLGHVSVWELVLNLNFGWSRNRKGKPGNGGRGSASLSVHTPRPLPSLINR